MLSTNVEGEAPAVQNVALGDEPATNVVRFAGVATVIAGVVDRVTVGVVGRLMVMLKVSGTLGTGGTAVSVGAASLPMTVTVERPTVVTPPSVTASAATITVVSPTVVTSTWLVLINVLKAGFSALTASWTVVVTAPVLATGRPVVAMPAAERIMKPRWNIAAFGWSG